MTNWLQHAHLTLQGVIANHDSSTCLPYVPKCLGTWIPLTLYVFPESVGHLQWVGLPAYLQHHVWHGAAVNATKINGIGFFTVAFRLVH